MIKNSNIKKAFTLIEAMTAMVIVGTIAITCLATIRPGDIKKDALRKSGQDNLLRITQATKAIVSFDSTKHNMTVLKNTSGTAFTLATDSNKYLYLSQLYKKHLGSRLGSNVDTTYTGTALKNESGSAVGNLKVSNFSGGIFIKNGTYMAFKINSDCTASETNTIYDPSKTTHTVSNSCGLIFYDVNGINGPNTVGVDMYILSMGKFGVK